MNKYLLLAIAVAAIGAMALLWPTQRTVTLTNLPWQVETLPEGGSRVFGITLGRTTAAQAQRILGQTAEIGLFEDQRGDLSLEAFFSNVELGSIVARVIARLGADQETLQRLRGMARARKPMPSGAFRLKLSDAGVREVQDWPVVGITYVPTYARLDAQTLEARFGEPAEILSGTEARRYWLYPAVGLAIITNTEGRTLFEYVAPGDFAQLRTRLHAGGLTGAESR
jgi:hypothetical protein